MKQEHTPTMSQPVRRLSKSRFNEINEQGRRRTLAQTAMDKERGITRYDPAKPGLEEDAPIYTDEELDRYATEVLGL